MIDTSARLCVCTLLKKQSCLSSRVPQNGGRRIKFKLTITFSLTSASAYFNKLVNSFHAPTTLNAPHNQVTDTSVCLCDGTLSEKQSCFEQSSVTR